MSYGATSYGAGLYGASVPFRPVNYEEPPASNYGTNHMSTTSLDVANAALTKLGADRITSLSENSNRARAMNDRIEWCKWAVLRLHYWNFALRRTTVRLKTITNIVNGSGLIRVTVTDHGFVTGDQVRIVDVVGTTEANAKWTISKIDDDTFDLDSSTFTNAYTSGGKCGYAANHDFDWEHPIPTDCLRVKSVQGEKFDTEWLLENNRILTDTQPVLVEYVANVTNYGLMDVLFRECLANYLAWDTCIRITQSNQLRDQLWEDFKAILPKSRFVDATEDSLRKLGAHEYVRSRFDHNIGYVTDPRI